MGQSEEFMNYAKKNKKIIINKLLSDKKAIKDKTAVFMASSPGAGKTEAIQTLVALYPQLFTIDADFFRTQFPGYNGSNSDLYQRGSVLLVNATLDEVLNRGYSFILDGTFATNKVMQNIERSLK